MAVSAPDLSLVIPAFNEAHRLPASLEQVAGYCGGMPWSYEVLVVVEKSADRTLELALQAVAKQENFRVIDNKVHRGKGYAVRCGMLQARGAVVFYMDADLSVPLEEIGAFIKFFEGHPEVDVLVGNRQHSGSRIVKAQSWLRRTMGQTFNHLIQLSTSLKIRDTQCGFKAFRREAAREIFSRATMDGFAFDVEALILAERLGLKVVDLPVRWINSPESKVHIVRDSVRMLADAIRVRGTVGRTLRERPAAKS